MTMTPMAPKVGMVDEAPAPVLSQYLLACPRCGDTGAAHVNEAEPVTTLVRFVCRGGCRVAPEAVLARLTR